MPAYRSKTIIQGSFWLAAILVGFVAVGFHELVIWIQDFYFYYFNEHPIYVTAATPILFFLATLLVVKLAPHAHGSGIPQAHRAMMISLVSHKTASRGGLVSIRTAFVKLISATLALLGGASIGREGPTVQISAALFGWIGIRVKRFFPHVDFHSYLVAGAAAGISAAFNTPLAGISFALEEMAEGLFAQIKQTVMVSVIIAGIATQSILGNYLYFGRPSLAPPDIQILLPAIVIGLAGGLLGALFARALAYPVFERFRWLRFGWWQKALLCGIIVAAINFFSAGDTSGSGYEITRHFMNTQTTELPLEFSLEKLITTIFSYLSGMAGGIFSPSLAIGAGLGSTVAELLQFPEIRTCALLGMVAFFTGAIQAPLTGVIIVMEMTDLHVLILPLMISAFIAQGTSKFFMPTPLYHYLAHYRT